MEFFSDDNLGTQRNENTKNTDTNNIDGNNTDSNNTNESPSYEEYFKDSQSNNHQNSAPKPFPNVFALFAKSLGVFSIFCAVFSVFFGSFICGGLAIVLGILSKGYDTKMEKNARIGLITGTIGITLQISILAFSVYNIIHIPEFREQFNSIYEQMYGEPMDDSINELLDKMGIPSSEGGIL